MRLLVGSLLIPLVVGWPSRKDQDTTVATSAEQVAEAPDSPDADIDAIVEVDLDSNGSPDLRKFYRDRGGQRQIVRMESDLNRDGVIDVYTFYKGGVIAIEEFDGDFDGHVDWRDLYKNGVRIKAEIDTDHNLTFDCIKNFSTVAGGVERLDSIERDTVGNGMIDYWEIHEEDGKVHVYRDIDFDGKMDIPETKPAASSTPDTPSEG